MERKEYDKGGMTYHLRDDLTKDEWCCCHLSQELKMTLRGKGTQEESNFTTKQILINSQLINPLQVLRRFPYIGMVKGLFANAKDSHLKARAA